MKTTRNAVKLWTSWSLLLLILSVLILHFYVTSSVRPLWSDEIITYNLSTSTWREFVSYFSTYEANPPLYYIINRIIVSLLGESEVSLRLQSLLWSVAFVVTVWKIGLRYFDPYASFVALIIVTIGCGDFLWYVTEARPYTLLCFSTALAIFISSKYALIKPKIWQLVGICLTFVLLTYSHVFGTLYGILILTGVAAASILERRDWVIQAVVSSIGVGTIIFWLPFMLSVETHALDWIPVPAHSTAYRQYGMSIDYQPYLMLLVSISVISVFQSRSDRLVPWTYPNSSLLKVALAAAIGCLLIVPIIFIESHFARPLFWHRYFLGLLACYFLFFGTITQYLLSATRFDDFQRYLQWVLISAFFVLSFWPTGHRLLVVGQVPSPSQYIPNSNVIDWIDEPIFDLEPFRNVPVVFTDGQFFEQVDHYSRLDNKEPKFIFIEGVDNLTTNDSLEQIFRETRDRFGAQAARQILLVTHLDATLPLTARQGVFQIVKVGNVSLPYYQYDIGHAYLLKNAKNDGRPLVKER